MCNRFRWAALALAVASCRHASPHLVTGLEAAPPLTVFSDIAVFAATAPAPAVAHQDVWIRAGRIEWLGPAGQKSVPPEATVVAGAGLTLMPGLIDGHVHAAAGASPPWLLRLPDPERNLEAYLFAGITTAVDVGDEAGLMKDLRADLAAHRRIGPRLLIAGPVFTAPGGHPVALIKAVVPWPLGWLASRGIAEQVGTPAEADHALDGLLPLKPDLIKLVSDELPLGVPTLDAEVAKEIVRRAHAAGLKAVAHVGSNADMAKMLDAGVDLFVHDVYREKLSDELAERVAKAGVPVEPTLAVFDEIDRYTFGDLSYSALAIRIAEPEVLRALQHRPEDFTVPKSFEGWLAVTHANRQTKFDNVVTLRRHGVTILVGSDSPNLGHFPGAALHTALDDLVQAGLSPAEALVAATATNAAAFGLAKEVGTIEAGKRADLLLIRGDPSADIYALEHIEAVYQEGQRVLRQP